MRKEDVRGVKHIPKEGWSKTCTPNPYIKFISATDREHLLRHVWDILSPLNADLGHG